MYPRDVSSFSAPDRFARIASSPVLVVGAPRSGTTRLQRILLADPRFAGGQESHFFASFGGALRDFDRKRGMSRPHGLACYWTRDELVEELRGLWHRMAAPVLAVRPEAEHLVEKTPDHALWLDVAREVLPDARVVHVVRDSRAVVASLLAAGRADWGRDWAPRSLDAAIDVWIRHVSAALEAAPDAVRIRSEAVEADAAGAVARLLGALGMPCPPESACAMVEQADARATAGGGFVAAGAVGRHPPEPEGFVRGAGADGWRRELGLLARRRVWRRTAQLMERLGYREDGSAVAP
jgi:hypothetical protein